MQQIDDQSTGVRVRFATDDEITNWDKLVLDSRDEGNVFRCSANIDGMRVQGKSPVYLFVDGVATTAFRVEVKPLGSYWVVIGPAVATVEQLIDTSKALAAFAANHGVAAVRVRPQLMFDPERQRRLHDAGATRVPSWMPDHTIVIDLTGSEAEVMARFRTRARRWIKRAGREGVTIERVAATSENARVMSDLLAATADQRFPHPGVAAVEELIHRWMDADAGQLFFARHDGEVVAAAFALRSGPSSLYLIGGSVRRSSADSSKSGLGANGVGHALQWDMMKWAKEHGCTRYDMYGTPSSQFLDDESHPLYGVGQFKKSFNNEVTDYLGCYQFPANRFRAWVIWQFELLIERAKYSRHLNKRLSSVPQPDPDHVWLHQH